MDDDGVIGMMDQEELYQERDDIPWNIMATYNVRILKLIHLLRVNTKIRQFCLRNRRIDRSFPNRQNEWGRARHDRQIPSVCRDL
jgi:hypothetical protein